MTKGEKGLHPRARPPRAEGREFISPPRAGGKEGEEEAILVFPSPFVDELIDRPLNQALRVDQILAD